MNMTEQLYTDIEWCWAIGEKHDKVNWQLNRMAKNRQSPAALWGFATPEQVTAVYYASEWVMQMEHIAYVKKTDQ